MHDVIEIEARYKKARSLVSAICRGDARWRMSVPVDRENDSDMVLTASLDDIPKLIEKLAEARRLSAKPDSVAHSATTTAL